MVGHQAVCARMTRRDCNRRGLDAERSTSWRRIVEQALSAGHPSMVIATHQLSALEGLLMNVVSLPRDKS